jgi:hypothetical protein
MTSASPPAALQPRDFAAAYRLREGHGVDSGELTRGPWDAGLQHAGPPLALVCRAIEQAAAPHGLTHLGRLTANLLRPVPIGPLQVEVQAEHVGRTAGHFAAQLLSQGKLLARVTALLQREAAQVLPSATPGHPLPAPPRPPEACAPAQMPFAGQQPGYADLVETRLLHGRFFNGPCSAWFRLRHPLVLGEDPSPYQRVVVAADSGNGISAALDLAHWTFVNGDLTVNLLRRPVGEWVLLDARTALGGNGCGLAESALYDSAGLIGRATQTLAVRQRG